MNKTMKIITTALLFVMIISLATSVFAGSIDGINITADTSGTTEVQGVGRKVLGVIRVVGIFAAVAILMVVGVRYMMGSAEEKAEYKKVMIPYIIGAVLLFAAATIVPKLAEMAGNL